MSGSSVFKARADIDGVQLRIRPKIRQLQRLVGRAKCHEAGTRERSNTDAIHVATAGLHDECEGLYTGAPGFADVAGIETIVLER